MLGVRVALGPAHAGLEQPRVAQDRPVVAERVAAEAERVRVLEREVAHRRAPDVHVEDAAAQLARLHGTRRPRGRPRGSAPASARRHPTARTRPCPSRSRAPPTAGSSGFSASSSSCRIETGSEATQPNTRHIGESMLSRRRGRNPAPLALRSAWLSRSGNRAGSGGRGRASCAGWSARVGEGGATAPSGARPRSPTCRRRACAWWSRRWARATTWARTRTPACLAPRARASRRSAGRRRSRSCCRCCGASCARRGAVAVHGDRHTDFVAAVCAAHLHEARGVEPAEALARAAAAGLMVNGYTCALLGVEPADVDALMRSAGPANGGIEGVGSGVCAAIGQLLPRFLLHTRCRGLAEDQVRQGFLDRHGLGLESIQCLSFRPA